MTDQTERPILDGRSFERLVQRVYCSFCGLSDIETDVMVANGHGAYICEVCIGIASQIASAALSSKNGDVEYDSWIESLNTTDDRPQVRSI